jgi:peptidoglycan-N-acetylglucosamine deacetylase
MGAAAGVLAYAVRVPSSSLLAPSVYKGAGTRAAIALTFDDGPSESTPELLEILAAHSAPATFFQCGANVRRLPQVARDVALAGHEIGNHTETHPLLCGKSG